MVVTSGKDRLAHGRIGGGGGGGGFTPLPLCAIGTAGPGSATRLYFTSISTGAYLQDPLWPLAEPPGLEGWNLLSFTPTGTETGGSQSNDAVNLSAQDVLNTQYSITIGSGPLLDAIHAGGQLKFQGVGVSRSGVGINEASQFNFHSLSVRVLRGGTPGTLVGQPIVVGQARATERFIAGDAQNRGVVAVYTPVPSALSTDRLVVESGWYHQGPISGGTGAAFQFRDNQAADLPEGNTPDELFNSWIQFGVYASLSGGSHPDLAGDPDEDHASRCDHAHHLLRDYAPSVGDDSADGIPVTTMWTNTLTGQTWVLVDGTPGAAVWLAMTTNNHGTLAGLADDDHLQYMRGLLQLADPAATSRDGDLWVETA